MTASIAFAAPWAFALLPLPFLARRLLARAPHRAGRLRVPDTLVPAASGDGATSGGGRPASLFIAAVVWVLLVVALAGPRTMMPSAALAVSGRELVLVLDFSGSMERKDFRLDGRTVRRIEAVKAVAGEFLARRAGDRVGLVLFAEVPMLASPPTFDLGAVASVLQATEIGTLGRSTAIGDGLGLALKQLDGSAAPEKAVVLLSDGTGTAGAVDPEAAAGLARALGIRVHTIALGTDDSVADGGAASVVDERTLALIAAASGGETFRVRSTEDLRAVTEAIDRLEAGRSTGAAVAVPRELWPWPAAAALASMVAGCLLGRRRT